MKLASQETTQELAESPDKISFWARFWGKIEARLPGWLQRLDRGILALIIVFVLTLPLFTPRIYASDEIKYFSYLHSIFFDRDVNFTNEYTYFYQSNPQKYEDFKKQVLDKPNEKGLPINEGPVGSALLWSPFYGVAHVVALVGNAVGLKSFKPDGFSTPYIWAVTLASLFYGFAGLIFSYLFCRNFIPRFYAAFATIIIWLATPVLFYLSLTPPMSHANSLFMISLWLWLWYRSRGWRLEPDGTFVPEQRRGSIWLLLGVLGGLMTMVREQDGTIMIVAALESLWLYWHDWGNRKSKIAASPPLGENRKSEFLKLFGKNLLFLGGLILGLVPQFIIYLALNGRLGPSKTVGDKLQFFNPEVVGRFGLLLIDPDHGLFWWVPVIILALIGLGLMLRQPRFRFIAVILLAAFVAELYISASFQTWTMKGSFGPRRLVGISPAYIVGLAYLAWWLAELKKGWKVNHRVLIISGILFVAWNFGLIIQFSAIRSEASRQNLDPARVVVDQFTAVPGKLVDTAYKFVFEREKFYKK